MPTEIKPRYSGAVLLTIQAETLVGAVLADVNLTGANLVRANLTGADLRDANLTGADLRDAVLRDANLTDAVLADAVLADVNLTGANLTNTKGLVKIMGVIQTNLYWKRFDAELINNNYQFKIGLNTLRPHETFASDDRVLCSYPGFHFASRSWCKVNYPDRPFEALIRIPADAQINEPWATDGKASADKIEILQVFDTRTGEDVTEKFR